MIVSPSPPLVKINKQKKMSELHKIPSSSSLPPPMRSASLSMLLPKSTNKKRQMERQELIDDMKRPKTHSSALLVPLLDSNGECEQRQVLRNRFSFYKETKLPAKLPPVVRHVMGEGSLRPWAPSILKVDIVICTKPRHGERHCTAAP